MIRRLTESSYLLIDGSFRHLTRKLCAGLPPPFPDSGCAEPNQAAVAQACTLHPVSTVEFEFAAMFVLARNSPTRRH